MGRVLPRRHARGRPRVGSTRTPGLRPLAGTGRTAFDDQLASTVTAVTAVTRRRFTGSAGSRGGTGGTGGGAAEVAHPAVGGGQFLHVETGGGEHPGHLVGQVGAHVHAAGEDAAEPEQGGAQSAARCPEVDQVCLLYTSDAADEERG